MLGHAPARKECNAEGRSGDEQHGRGITFWNSYGFRIVLRMRLGHNLDWAHRAEDREEEKTTEIANDSCFHRGPQEPNLNITSPWPREWHDSG